MLFNISEHLVVVPPRNVHHEQAEGANVSKQCLNSDQSSGNAVSDMPTGMKRLPVTQIHKWTLRFAQKYAEYMAFSESLAVFRHQ